MAKFLVKITLDNGTVIDDVSALFPDQVIAPMIAAAQKLEHVDSEGSLITGGRAVTYALRWFLTNLVKDYANEAATQIAITQAKAQVDGLLSGISIEENT